jgi:hypothetical protein
MGKGAPLMLVLSHQTHPDEYLIAQEMAATLRDPEYPEVAKPTEQRRYFLSYTDLIYGLTVGTLKKEDLQGAHFILGCVPAQILTHNIQNRVTWANNLKPRVYDRDTVRPEEVDDLPLQRWSELREILCRAYEDGRVHFARNEARYSEDYPTLIRKLLAEGHEVWWQEWRTE